MRAQLVPGMSLKVEHGSSRWDHVIHAPNTRNSRSACSTVLAGAARRSACAITGLGPLRHVERARSDGHPDVAWLALLADVISKNADPAVLQAWPAWANEWAKEAC
jgi:hypothetical protein